MNYSAPDNIVTPIGNGSIAFGLVQGFQELLSSEEIDHIPKIYGVQSHNCNTMYRKFHGLTEVFDAKPTIPEGIELKFSSKSQEVVEAIRISKGEMLEVTEEDILEGLKNASSALSF